LRFKKRNIFPHRYKNFYAFSLNFIGKSIIRKERLANNPKGLANSLRGMGTGAQPSWWDELKNLKIPVQKAEYFPTSIQKFLCLLAQFYRQVDHLFHDVLFYQAVRKERLANNPKGLANSLRGMGTGAQPSWWDELFFSHRFLYVFC
jgi:hypothetical protein